MMEAVRSSETSVNFNVTTRRYIPEVSKLQVKKCTHSVTILARSSELDPRSVWMVRVASELSGSIVGLPLSPDPKV
jgi:hypothetical protein